MEAQDVVRDAWLALGDDELRRQCHEDFYRASGPGGQKRNKTESAVRLRHEPSGLSVVANESRSREENRRRALRRMREAIAYRVRQPFDEPVDRTALLALLEEGGLRVGKRDPRFLTIAAVVLDLIEARQARLADAAAELGQPTAQLVRFLRATPELWQAAQQLRDRYGQPHLH